MSINMNNVAPKIINLLLNFAKNDGFKNPYYTTEPGSQKGDNFMGIISKLKIEDRDTSKVLNIIIKSAASDPHTRSVLATHLMFSREVWTYRNLLPRFRKIKKSDDTLLVFSECIESSIEENNEWLAFEDMSEKGFIMHRPRLASLDKKHIYAALTALAEFHVLSYALKKFNPETFNYLLQQANDIVFLQENNYKSYMHGAINRTIKLLTNEVHKEKIQNNHDTIYQRIVKVLKPNKFAVFCHGDFWKNNILFKYKDNVPVSVCPLDYQILRASSPTIDILYLLVCSTNQEERKTSYFEYLRHYYTQLCQQFKLYGLDHIIFTWPEFLDEVKRCSIFGLGIAIMVLPFMTCSSENVPDPEDIVSGNKSIDDPESLVLYTERIEGVIEDFINYGYI